MTVFVYELRQNARYIAGWTAAMALCIFCMTPVYYSFIGMAGWDSPVSATMADSDFFRSAGISIELLQQPLGIYSFLTSFFMLAAGVFGLHFGISIYTKEWSGGSREYLFTKPCTRAALLGGKAGAVACGGAAVGGAYLLASWLSMSVFRPGFEPRAFFLIAFSLVLVLFFFAAAELLIGVAFPHDRNPLLTAGALVILLYCMSSFSRVIGWDALGYLTPFAYFSAADIVQTGFYAWGKLLCCLGGMAVFLLAAFRLARTKDVR